MFNCKMQVRILESESQDRTLTDIAQTKVITTRNSALADKPRDAFVQNSMMWLT